MALIWKVTKPVPQPLPKDESPIVSKDAPPSTPQDGQTTAPKKKKPTSEKRIAANRRNAQKSTGPRTAKGKRKSCRNSLKHGIFAKEHRRLEKNDGESLKEYNELQQRFIDDWCPEGAMEEILVDRIVDLVWRMGAVRRYELRRARREMYHLVFARLQRKLPGSESLSLAELLDGSRRETVEAFIDDPERMVFHYTWLEHLLCECEDAVEQKKVDRQHLGPISTLLKEFGVNFQFLVSYFVPARKASFEEWSPSGNTDPALMSDAEWQAALLRDLRGARRNCTGWLQVGKEVLSNRELRRPDLPDSTSAELLMRYDTTLDRQLYRAIEQLQRLQQSRRAREGAAGSAET